MSQCPIETPQRGVEKQIDAEEMREQQEPLAGRSLKSIDEVDWPNFVVGHELADQLMQAFRRHMVLGEGCCEAICLWVLHTHCLDACMISPRLAITSPEKGCGKTTLLDLLSFLVPRSLLASNASTASIFRAMESFRPTLLIDEADTFLRDNNPLRGILNSGHRKGGSVLRSVGDQFEPRLFSTWGAVAIAMIGRLPDTLADRSINVRLRRKLAAESIYSFRLDRTQPLLELQRKCRKWCADHRHELEKADPHLPPALLNRTADNWRPLISIADTIGGRWPEIARATAESLSRPNASYVSSPGTALLTDIRSLFESCSKERWSSADLTRLLHRLETQPWAEWNGRGLTQNALARLLEPFDIYPSNMKFEGRVLKGYSRDQFESAFQSYLTLESGAAQENTAAVHSLSAEEYPRCTQT